MTNSQALARAQHELNFYRQVKKDGVTMTDNLDFWEKIVEALEKQVAKPKHKYGSIRCVCGTEVANYQTYCDECGQRLLDWEEK